MGAHVVVGQDESIENALRRFRRFSDRVDSRPWHKRRYGYYESPSALRRKRKKMLSLKGKGPGHFISGPHKSRARHPVKSNIGYDEIFARTGNPTSVGPATWLIDVEPFPIEYQNIRLKNINLILSTPFEVKKMQTEIGAQMPQGYQKFVTAFGLGDLNTFIRIYTPRRILSEYKECQDRWRKYYFWDEGRDVLSKEQVLECIIIADTFDGDEMIFHPSDPTKIYLLPIESEEIFTIGSTLVEAIRWILNWNVRSAENNEDEQRSGLYFEAFPASTKEY